MNSSTVFRDYAPRYAACGFRTIPVNREKIPLIRNYQKIGINTYQKLIPKFEAANVAVIDGSFGGITRVDVDDPALVEECVVRFGKTPVVIATPSGGFHLCYRANGEGRKLRLGGKKIDILGLGGFGLMPPSETNKGRYEFLEGSIDRLRGDLPTIQGLDSGELRELDTSVLKQGDGRNNVLFITLKERALKCETEAEIQFNAEQINSGFAEPLSEREVRRIVGSVCRYKSEGRLLVNGCEATAMIPISMFEMLIGNPSELTLLTGLRLAHGARQGRPFALAQPAAEKFGMSVKTMRRAQQGLEKKGLLEIVHAGEQGKRGITIARLI